MLTMPSTPALPMSTVRVADGPMGRRREEPARFPRCRSKRPHAPRSTDTCRERREDGTEQQGAAELRLITADADTASGKRVSMLFREKRSKTFSGFSCLVPFC